MSAAMPLLEFLEYLQFNQGLSANTVAAYRTDLQKFRDWLLEGRQSWETLSSENLQDFVLQLMAQRKASSNARMLSSIKRFYQWANQQYPIENNPVQQLKAPKAERKIPKVLSEVQIEALLEAPDLTTALGIRDRAILELMYASGLRVSEVVGLPFEQLNLSAGVVQVTGKGAKERIVPIGEVASEWLQRYLQGARGELVGKKRVSTLFVSRLGRPMTRQTLWHRVRKLAESVGIFNKLSPHGLRHAFATHLINHGADLRSVQLLLGHSDLSTTQIYTHVAKQRLQSLHQHHHPRG
ncbi:site-specific tyrosine recombinase XerD [Thiomicrorhabdus sp. 6S3-12]|uniref:site-specific tyrosine recombinase XerD n=1 Tax=Thiomicrorhabdus sp. 6S3-12 TaxID=2819681 RepID=UPI001AADA011|nr:site-specific tyrosine recombinase XerD [Thiomicrorhabdus sp. 6S3-12]MBO1922936.1 site-specific tyrosine recombinase XerD [Thiomicrorhabdus sp. 6S3-12]